MKGAVRRRGAGWEYYYRELDPGTGRWRQRSKGGFPTRVEATAALRAVLHTMDRGSYVSPTRLTARVPRGAVASRDHHDRAAEHARQLRPQHHRALRDAMRWQLLTRNVTEAADPPKEGAHLRPEIQTWTPETLRSFLDGTRGDRRHVAWLLLASTGMRRGEVLGLRWVDVDLPAGQLAIRQTLVTADMITLFGEPKSRRSRRVVALDGTTLDALQRHRRHQLEEEVALGPAYEDHALVFARADGRPYEPDESSREFDRRIKRLGVPRIRLHDLRHRWATLALQAGIHPKVVSERLGHSTIAITLDTYSHVTPSLQREAADQVAAVIFGAPGVSRT